MKSQARPCVARWNSWQNYRIIIEMAGCFFFPFAPLALLKLKGSGSGHLHTCEIERNWRHTKESPRDSYNQASWSGFAPTVCNREMFKMKVGECHIGLRLLSLAYFFFFFLLRLLSAHVKSIDRITLTLGSLVIDGNHPGTNQSYRIQ